MIELDFWETKEYPRVVIDGIRHYDIDGNHYPSVTQVTSYYGKDKLNSWRKRVGEAEAQKICDVASANGTYIHYLAEQYILGNEIDHKESTLLQKLIFGKFKSSLDNISSVYLLENTLYSHKLKLAGTVDCVGIYAGKLSVIDFKTAKSEKPIEWIENYFVQTNLYANMIWEMYHIKIQQVVILFACSDLTTPIVIKKIDKNLLELTKKYYYHYKTSHEQKSTGCIVK